MAEWHTVSALPGRSSRAVERLAGLDRVGEVYFPVRTVRVGRFERHAPWLGSLVLLRWIGSDPIAWHDVRGCDGVSAILGGWPPWTIADVEVERFRMRVAELSSGALDDRPPPCGVGDEIQFSFLSFYQLRSRCLWVGNGIVGVRVKMLGHDHLLQVPWEFIERVEERSKTPQYGRRRGWIEGSGGWA
jgi:hypothetical protein